MVAEDNNADQCKQQSQEQATNSNQNTLPDAAADANDDDDDDIDIIDDEDLALGDNDDGDNDDYDSSHGDSWIEELECALLADIDLATIKKLADGKRIPNKLRPDLWRTLLALNDANPVRLCTEFDLENQQVIRRDCESLLVELADSLSANAGGHSPDKDITRKAPTEVDLLKWKSSFETTITTYVKARPEQHYVSGNGWLDILKILFHIDLNDLQLYQIFYRIVDRYIPKGLSERQPPTISSSQESASLAIDGNTVNNDNNNIPHQNHSHNQSQQQIQAYHLLRLLIQYHDPLLCSILDSRKVTPSLYAKDWFCSLFARSCSPNIGLLIWDTHFKMADPFLIFFAAIVMVVNASDELKQDMSREGMLEILKTMPGRLEANDIEDLYYLVSNHCTNSTPRSIRAYSHLFFLDTFENTYVGSDSPSPKSDPKSASSVKQSNDLSATDQQCCRLQLDMKTTQLTQRLDLSRFLCLPIVPAEIFAIDAAHLESRRSSPTTKRLKSSLKYFLVDCRPAEQYNAGHLSKAFHLDCSLMLREPASFATAVQALFDIQRQVVASKSASGGQHLCFIGSGHEEDDQYVNMVVASFLQRYQKKFVSIVVGGFGAIHDYVTSKSDLNERFSDFIVDHNKDLCKACYTKSAEALARYNLLRKIASSALPSPSVSTNNSYNSLSSPSSSLNPLSSSAQTLFASTASFLRGSSDKMMAQSGLLDKFTTAFVTKSSVFKERLVETLNTSVSARDHVSSLDRGLGKRYTGSGVAGSGGNGGGGGGSGVATTSQTGQASSVAAGHRDATGLLLSINAAASGQQQPGSTTTLTPAQANEEPLQEVQLDAWRQEEQILHLYKCTQVKGKNRYPGYVGLSRTHLWILREIPHNTGYASIAAKRQLNRVVQITSKRSQPDMIIFRYGDGSTRAPASPTEQNDTNSNQQQQQPIAKGPPSPPIVVASDHLLIPTPFELIRLAKLGIVRLMDEQRLQQQQQQQQGQPEQTGVSVETDNEDRQEAKDKPSDEIQTGAPERPESCSELATEAD